MAFLFGLPGPLVELHVGRDVNEDRQRDDQRSQQTFPPSKRTGKTRFASQEARRRSSVSLSDPELLSRRRRQATALSARAKAATSNTLDVSAILAYQHNTQRPHHDTKSSHKLQWLMYQMSNSTRRCIFSSVSVSPRAPLTWAQPVSPAFT